MFSSKVASILSILSLLLFVAVIVAQFMEKGFYAAPTSLWP